MKNIKITILSWLRKVKTLPKKYLIIGAVVVVVLIAGIVALIWRNTNSRTAESNTSFGTTQDKTSEGTADAPTDQPATPTDEAQPGANPDESTSSSGSTSKKQNKGSGSDSNAPAPAPQPDTSKPTTPGSFTVKNGPSGSRIMEWSASSDNVGVTGYHIYKQASANETSNWIIDTITDGSTDDTEEDPIFCSGGPRTYYAVRAFDAAGNLSDPIVTSIPDEEWVNCTPIGV